MPLSPTGFRFVLLLRTTFLVYEMQHDAALSLLGCQLQEWRHTFTPEKRERGLVSRVPVSLVRAAGMATHLLQSSKERERERGLVSRVLISLVRAAGMATHIYSSHRKRERGF